MLNENAGFVLKQFHFTFENRFVIFGRDHPVRIVILGMDHPTQNVVLFETPASRLSNATKPLKQRQPQKKQFPNAMTQLSTIT